MSELLMHELAVTDQLKFSGPLTVRVAKQIRTRIIEALRQFPSVTIDCSGATEVDLSFIQLVLSARKSAAASAKILSLAPPADGALLEALRQAGLVAPADRQPVADQTFWLS
jgi:ABC-type transporter Mla MlaB component